MLQGLQGRTFIVTGGAGGIGGAAVRRLVEAGARVAIVDRNAEAGSAIAASLGEAAVFIPFDLSAEDAVEHYMRTAISHFGSIDGVFNNAAILTPPRPFIEQDTAAYNLQWAVNERAVFIGTRDALAYFKSESRPGAIVNTSALAGVTGFRNLASYSSSKHAIVGLSRVAAAEGAKYGVRVNVVCPGFIVTDTIVGSMPPEALRQTEGMMAMGRGGRPEEVAALAAWLLSDEASYVSGAVIPVDGALSAALF